MSNAVYSANKLDRQNDNKKKSAYRTERYLELTNKTLSTETWMKFRPFFFLKDIAHSLLRVKTYTHSLEPMKKVIVLYFKTAGEDGA